MNAVIRYGSPGALAFLVLVGAVKDSLTFLPVDVTLLGALAVLAVVFLALVRSRFHVPRSTAAVLAVFAGLTLGLVNATLVDYSLTKTVRLFTLTLLAAVAPTVLLRSEPALRRFLTAVAVGGAALFAVEVGVAVRFGAGLADALPYGRLCAPLLLWAVVLAVHGGLAKPWIVLIVPPVLFVMGQGGLRGPLAATAAAIALALVRMSGKFRYAPVLLGIVGLSLVLVLQADPDISPDRVDSAPDQSTESRIPSYERTVALIQEHPLGVGWGDWGNHVHLFDVDRPYPHDLALEVTSEAGWAAGVLLVGVLAWLLVHGRRLDGEVGRGALAMFVLALGLALVSGDINDNRLLFVFGGCLAARCLAPPVRPPLTPTTTEGGAGAMDLVGAGA